MLDVVPVRAKSLLAKTGPHRILCIGLIRHRDYIADLRGLTPAT